MIFEQLSKIDVLVAKHIIGWEEVKGGHFSPQHRPSKDYPGTIIDDWGNKGEHHYLTNEDDRIYFCGCNSTTEIPQYSADIAAAWEVVEKVWRGQYFRLDRQIDYRLEGEVWGWIAGIQDYEDVDGVWAETAPLAICLAALKAKGITVYKR